MYLSDPIKKVKGIGDRTAALYAKLGIVTVGELIGYFPREYERYEAPVLISAAQDGSVCTVEGILTESAKPVPGNARRMIIARIRDVSGEMEFRWFNSPYVLKQLPLGRRLLFRGKVSKSGRRLCMMQPEIFTEEAYRLRMKSMRPVYHLTAGLSSNAISKAVTAALSLTEIPDPMPLKMRRQRGFMKLADAYGEIHAPKDETVTREAVRRLAELGREFEGAHEDTPAVGRSATQTGGGRARTHREAPEELETGVECGVAERVLQEARLRRPDRHVCRHRGGHNRRQ